MIKYILVLIIMDICFVGCSQQNNEFSSLHIEFDGFGKEFYEKYNLWNESLDSIQICEILESYKKSSKILICPSYRPVMWKINVIGNSKYGKSKQLFRIISNNYGKLALLDGEQCYENNELIQRVIEIMKVSEIKTFKGQMTQTDYDKIIFKR